MLLFCVILIFLPFLNSSDVGYKSYKDHKVYEVEGNEENIQQVITQLTSVAEIPYYEQTKSTAKIIIPPKLDKRFSETVARNKLKKKVLIEDYSKFIQREKPDFTLRSSTSFSWTNYYDIDDIYNYLKDMTDKYNWAHLYAAGSSYEGRQILGLRINTSNHTKLKVVIESGIHAREWIAPATTTYFINQLLTSSNPAIMSLRDKFEWFIFPVINPDGYHYSHTTDRLWRKTRSETPGNRCYGVDPNRNWDYNWGQQGTSDESCDEVYGGPKPFSERETASFSSFLKKNMKNMLAYISFHSTGQVLLVPYSDSKQHYDNYDDLIQIGNTSLKYGLSVNGVPYYGLGTAAEILYPCSGGSMDWVRNKLATPLVYTYELRGDKLPFHWPEERIPEQGEEVTQMLIGLFTQACSMGYCQ